MSVHKNKTDVGMELEMANVVVGGWMEIGRRPDAAEGDRNYYLDPHHVTANRPEVNCEERI